MDRDPWIVSPTHDIENVEQNFQVVTFIVLFVLDTYNIIIMTLS